VTLVTVANSPDPLIVEGELFGFDQRERQEKAQAGATEILNPAKHLVEAAGVTITMSIGESF
jgi:hypothetical protein